MDTLQLFMVAISIIVLTRTELIANDCLAAHMAAGIHVEVWPLIKPSAVQRRSYGLLYGLHEENKGIILCRVEHRNRATTVVNKMRTAKKYLLKCLLKPLVSERIVYFFLKMDLFTHEGTSGCNLPTSSIVANKKTLVHEKILKIDIKMYPVIC